MTLALALSLLAAWQPAEVIVDDRLNAPVTAVGPDGTVHLVGAENVAADPTQPVFRVGVRTAPPGAAFGPERPFEAAGYEGVAAGVDASGTATVLFVRDERVSVSTGGAAPVALSTRPSRTATLAVSPGGAAVLAWVEGSRVMAAVREAGAFGPPQVVSDGAPRETDLSVAVGSRGDVRRRPLDARDPPPVS